MVQRGQLQQARTALQQLRGMLQNTEQEFTAILKAAELGNQVGWSSKTRHVFIGSHNVELKNKGSPNAKVC